jgi:hypothetical protein
MANNSSNKVKVTGYAKRTFFNSGIEYRDFSDNLVGLQLASDGGTPLFTMGNFSITTNLSPKKNKIYNQGTYSFFYTLKNLGTLIDSINIQKTEKAGLNLDITDPLSYVWYGSSSELIRTSVEYLKNQFPAAIYVDNKVGSITGNNITNYSYDSIKDESTFTVNSKYFINPFGIKYTKDSAITGTEIEDNPLRNLTNQYKYYTIEHSGITKDIIGFSGSVQTTNSDVVITVKGNPFPEITGLNFSQYSFLNPTYDGSIPYFIKPNVTKQEEFFASLNNLETNLLSKGTLPIYTSTFSVPEITDEGVIVHTQKILTFPVLSDGYNLNFFDGLYITYLDEITKIGEDLDESKTDIIKRKFVADVITGFDTIPRGDGDNLVLDGAKATKLIRIYGVSFDEVKKYINGIKFAHVITYGKKDNTPDSLVKDLSDMLGLYTQFGSTRQGRIITPFLSNLKLEQIDIVLFRRLILNVAWLWKSKGSRKAIEFLFRFIGAPELLVTFDEHIVIADKPLDIAKIKKLLYLYTGSSDISNLPFDKDGYPLPLPDGTITIVGYTSTLSNITGGTNVYTPIYDTMWFQNSGGWYRQTGGDNSQIDINTGNNPHVGPYDGGSLYLQQFTKCPLPDFNESIAINVTGTTLYENHFLNYNHGFVNGTSPDSDIFITTLEGTNNQFIEDCVDVTISIVNAPKLSGGTSVYELLCIEAIEEYELWLELIKEDCELIYSPEWYNVKNNYQVATSNYSQELVTAQCNENQSLEVCINFKDLEVIENPCDKYEVQFLDNGFIVFLDENGHTVTFDEFPQCCVAAGGEYFSYINEENNIAYFCAYEDPCLGEEHGVTADGYIIWEITGGNTIPDNIYCILGTGRQQVIEEDWVVNGCNDISLVYNDSSAIQTYINNNTDQNGYTSTFAENLIQACFTIVSKTCQLEHLEITVISSIPCCVYHGYDYTITTQEDGNQIIVCIPKTPSVAGSINSMVENTQTINLPLTEGYSEYVPDSNLNATPTNAATIATLNTEGVYVIATANPTTNVSTDYDTYTEDPDLGDCDKWQVAEIDQYGRITFTSIDPDNTEILDWTSTIESGGDQYKTCCIAKGYDYAQFVINKVTKSLMLSGLNSTGEFDNQTTGPSSITYACIDKNYIHCDDIEDLKLILGSTGFDGFYLPQTEEEGCDCEVNIRFDYMLKYDPAALIACSENCGGCECTTEGVGKNTGIRKSLATEQVESLSAQAALGSTSIFNTSDTTTNSSGPRTNTGNFNNTIPCIPTIFHDQTLESIYCPDFITFVSSEEESNLLLNNFDGTAGEELVWENDVIQLNPPVECCEALGGTVQSLYGNKEPGSFVKYYGDKWSETFQNFVDYEINGTFPIAIDPNIIISTDEFNILLNDLDFINDSECVDRVEQIWSDIPFCDNSIINLIIGNDDSISISQTDFNYITTQNICSLIPPSDCMHWSILLLKSRVSLIQAEAIKVLLEDCISVGKRVSDIDRDMITTQVKISETKLTNKKLIDGTNNKILKQQKSITNINSELFDITEQNISINTVNSTATGPMECSVYQNKIDIINGYNVEESCKSNITEGTPEQVSTNYNNCIRKKTLELSQLKITYEQLREECNIANESSTLIDDSISKGNTTKEELYTTNYNNALSKIEILQNSLVSCDIIELNSEATLITKQLNNIDGNIDTVAKLLDVPPSTIKDGNTITLTDEQITILEATLIRNNIKTNKINIEKLQHEKEISKLLEDQEKITSETNLKLSDLEIVLKDIKTSKGESYNKKIPCCYSFLDDIKIIIQDLSQLISDIETLAQECYDEWGVTIQSGYDNFINNGCGTYLSFIDDLKIKFTLEVDNNVIGTIPPSLIHYNLTTLPLTDNINPIWEWVPQNYSGVIIEGDEYDEVTVKNQIIQELISSGFTGLTNIFEPQWQTLDFNLSTSVCELLKQCYPDKQFFIGIEIENYECNVCLLIDNIQVNFNECDIVTKITTESCPMPELKCVIDNRKSWVYSDKGIQYVNSINDGSCIDVEINCEEIAGVHSAYSAILKTAQNRLWQNLEYRYTEYDFDHSDLIINTKSAAFKIDPAKSIECDVYNFWKNIDCDNCPTSCDLSCYILTEGDLYIATESGCTLLVWCDTVGDFIEYNGVVRSATTASLSSYTLTLTGSCDNPDFSCETYTTLLENKVTELKDEYYTLTADYNASLNATYAELKELGGDLTNFGITKNNCGSDTIIVGNYKDVNKLFGLITEDIDGTLSLFEIYVYNSTTPYTGGTETEILSGYTAQTFDYSTDITAECCKSLNSLLNDTGKYGMGLGKNYIWSETFSACTWRDLDNCQGDCSYTGPTTINSSTDITSIYYPCGTATTTTVFFGGLYAGASSPYTVFINKSDGTTGDITNINTTNTNTFGIMKIVAVNKDDANNLVSLGQNGLIKWSNNGGSTWNTPTIDEFFGGGAGEDMLSLAVDRDGSNSDVWIAGNEGAVSYSSDGGQNYIAQETIPFPGPPWEGFNNVSIGLYYGKYTDKLYAATTGGDSIYSGGSILASTTNPRDAAPTWTILNGGIQFSAATTGLTFVWDIVEESASNLVIIQYLIDDAGNWVSGSTGARASYDSGNTFDIIQPTSFMAGGPWGIQNKGGQLYMYGGGQEIKKLSSIGPPLTWTTQSPFINASAATIMDMTFISPLEGYSYESFPPLQDDWQLYHTIDGGITKELVVSASTVGYSGSFNVYQEIDAVNLSADTINTIYNICGKCYQFSGSTTITGTTQEAGAVIPFTATCCDVIGNDIISDPYKFNNWMINNYCTNEFNGCFKQVTCCDVEEVDICVKPLDFLDIPPSKIQVKQVFDEMVRMNLIDATNRQTISDYPTLRLFYHLYLVANDCGSELTGKLTYNNLFQFMDLIGDYWLELLEQVIPATTIMEGCDNSGKAYRNTIFDNNKFVYKKYVLNYNKCCPTKVSDNAIGCEDIDIRVEELCLHGDCMGQELEACNAELNALKDKLESIQEEIIRIKNLLDLPTGEGNIPCVLTEEEINNLNTQLISYQQQDIQINNEISNKQAECNTIQTNLQIQIATMNAQIANCDTFSDQIQQAEEELLLLEVGTFSYNSKVNYISELTEKYEKCVRLASTNVTNYDTVFITQMYNTNEYEGNVTVYGDDEWNESQQLIRDIDCEEYMESLPHHCGRGCRFIIDSCPDDTHDLTASGWSDLGFFDCDCTGTTGSTVATYETVTGPILQPSAGDIRTYNYGFQVPAGSAILGIRVSIRRKQEFDDRWIFSDHSVQLTYGGQPIGDPNTTTQGTPWGTNWETISYGNYITDLWGHPWTVDEINDPTFGVRYLPQINGTPGISNTGWLDCIKVEVYYYYNINDSLSTPE